MELKKYRLSLTVYGGVSEFEILVVNYVDAILVFRRHWKQVNFLFCYCMKIVTPVDAMSGGDGATPH